jgi:hypothetical protein
MNRILWNRLCRILLVTACGIVASWTLVRLITPVQTALASTASPKNLTQTITSTTSAESDLVSATAAVSPTSQIHSPNRDAVITQKGSLVISGFAWDAGVEPPFLAGDVHLTVEKASEWAYSLYWTPVVSASSYLVDEATNPQFTGAKSIYLGPATTFSLIKSEAEAGTYYYRVSADAQGVDPSRYSNVVSVVVPWSAASTFSLVSTLSADIAANGPMMVEVSIDSGPWNTATVTPTASWEGWEWSYAWSPLPEERDIQHAIRTRAQDAIGNFSAIDTITVTVSNKYYFVYFPTIYRRWPPIPYPPNLNDITDPEGDGSYTVSWSYPYTDPTVAVAYYILQEATNINFTSPITYYPGSGLSYPISGKGAGTYYYRVRGHNTWGPGEWSVVKSVTVVPPGYRDDFNTATNWAYRRGDDIIAHPDIFRIRYRNSNLYTLFVGSADFAVASPLERAPTVPYTIKARVRVVRDEVFDGRNFTIDYGNGHDFGIVFGGNSGTPCPADRSAAKHQGCLSHYYRLIMTYDKQRLNDPHWALKKIEYHDPNDDGKGKGTVKVEGTASGVNVQEWMEWKIEVTTSGIKVYINGQYRGQLNDSSYINDPYFGFFMSSAVDAGDIGVKWDWFEAKK